ncbi:hypothetical protein V8B97DRAFT_974149 [Scleroderma yunnanense]
MPMLAALFVVRPIPLPSFHLPLKVDQYKDYEPVPNGAVVPCIQDTNIVGMISNAVNILEGDSRQPLLGNHDANTVDIIGGAISIIEGDGRAPLLGNHDTDGVDIISNAVTIPLVGNHDTNTLGIINSAVSMVETNSCQPLLGNHRGVNYNGVHESSALTEIGLASCQSRPQAEGLSDIYGTQLLIRPEFYILITIVSLLTGTALMYINNVGVITLALYAKANTAYNEIEASAWQTAQVSILSICNWAGRILIGLVSDFMRTRLHLPRSYSLCIVSSLFIISQMTVISVSNIHTLWIASAIVGVAYGSLAGTLPSVVIDWFGLAHQSENWGWVTLSPVPSVNLFAVMFGRNLDAHTPNQHPDMSAHIQHAIPALSELLQDVLSKRQCLIGRECYVSSLRVTLMVSMVSLMLSILAVILDGWRNKRRTRSNE